MQQELENKSIFSGFNYLFVVVAIVLLATDMSIYFAPIRFLKYITLPVFVAVLLAKRLQLTDSNIRLVMPFALLVVYNLLKVALWSPVDYTELVFIASSFILFLVVDNFEVDMRGLTVICIIAFFAFSATNLVMDFSLDAFFRSETSTGETSMLSFLFGLLCLFFFVKKKYLWFLLSGLFVIMSFKRIVVMGVLACLFIGVMPRVFKKLVLNKWTIILGNCALIVFFFYLANGYFDEMVMQYTGLSISHFTQGRSDFFKLVLPELMDRRYEVFFSGIGQGNLVNILKSAGENDLFHNDTFKLFVESGIFIFLIFNYLLFSAKNMKQMLLFVFLNILFLTDNVMTYTPVILLVLIMAKQLEDDTEFLDSQPDEGYD